jgi:dipeptidyl aminopeptidase/acylaminoacyl peptidase
MTKTSSMRCIAGAALLAAAAALPHPLAAQGHAEYTVEFQGRSIDLRPYLQSFPYDGWTASYSAGRLFYFQDTPDGRFLLMQPLREGRLDPEAGRRVHAIDWSQRGFWRLEHDSIRGSMIVLGDERNDERFNLYRLDLADGGLRALTDVPYLYGWDFSRDRQSIGYIARYGTTEPYRNCLRILDLRSDRSREVVCEEGADHRIVWTGVDFSPDDRGVVLRVTRDGDRNQGNLAWVDLTAATPRLELLLPEGVTRYAFALGPLGRWAAPDRFLYVSDESGYANVYQYDLQARTSRSVTRVREESTFESIEIDGRSLLLVTHQRPYETEMVVLDPQSGEELGRQTVSASLAVLGFDDRNRFLVSRSSAASPFQADEMRIGLEGGRAVWRMEPRIRLPERLAGAIEQCDVERVRLPTFDTDPATGERRLLHAFLMTPKRPRENRAERLAVITSFYGGGNAFDIRAQVFCEAGIAWLSPAVRGSSGFGREFMALNDGDLGGDEIVDLFHAARFLEQRLGLEPWQIGVAGHSHGGYATMRALTFPPSTNQRGESYPFGFGIGHAGFSSILTFYEATNIPDWIILEAGDPATERDKLLDRSPLTHVERLRAPLLLVHGANDSRVGVTESRQFAARAQELGRPVRYVEFPGQGHSIVGLENQVRDFRIQFEFLREVVEAAGRR